MDDVDGQAVLTAKLHRQGGRLLELLNELEPVGTQPIADDLRDRAYLMLGRLAAELAISAADDFHFNRPAAGSVTGRALMETAITLRWVLADEAHATRWWKAGDAAIQKTLRGLGQSEDVRVVALRDGATVRSAVPGVQRMAREAGVELLYRRWYPALSAYAHATRVATMHAYAVRGEPVGPPPTIACLVFIDDAGLVVTEWARARSVPVPFPHP